MLFYIADLYDRELFLASNDGCLLCVKADVDAVWTRYDKPTSGGLIAYRISLNPSD